MKETKFEWQDSLYLENEKERKQLWDEIQYQKHRNSVRVADKKLRIVLALPYLLFSLPYTLYLSYFAPFFKYVYGDISLQFFGIIAKFPFIEQVVFNLRKLVKLIPLDEPYLSVVCFIIFSLVLPLIVATIIKTVIHKYNVKKCIVEQEDFGKTEKEQLQNLKKHEDEICSSKHYTSKLFKIFLSFVAIINTLLIGMGSVFQTCRLNYQVEVILFVEIGIVVGYFVTNMIIKKIYNRLLEDGNTYVVHNKVKYTFMYISERLKDIKEKEKHNAEKNKHIENAEHAFSLFKQGNYRDAEYLFNKYLQIYENGLQTWFDLNRDLDRIKDNKEKDVFRKNMNEQHNTFIHYEPYLKDMEVGEAIACMLKKSKEYEDDVATALGIISKNEKEIKKESIKKIAREVVAKYQASYLEKAEENYKIAVTFATDGDMSNAAKYFKLPALMKYEDSEPYYAITLLISENNPADYDRIQKILVNTKNKLKSEAMKDAADNAIKELAAIRKSRMSQQNNHSYTGVDSAVFNAAYSVYSGNNSRSSTNITSDESDFMDWIIAKNKEVRAYEDNIKKNDGKIYKNPMGDSDFPKDVESFPKDVESFPDSDSIW